MATTIENAYISMTASLSMLSKSSSSVELESELSIGLEVFELLDELPKSNPIYRLDVISKSNAMVEMQPDMNVGLSPL